jgi:CBS domain-containing protein
VSRRAGAARAAAQRRAAVAIFSPRRFTRARRNAMNVSEIMTRSPACCTAETSLRDVAAMMVEHDCGCIPVVEEAGKPIGTITDRDIVCRAIAEGRNPLDLCARDCMTEGAVTIAEDASIQECVDLLEEHRIRRAVVVDPQGRVCGIVAQADIARHGRDLGGEVVQGVSKEGGQPSAVH